MSYLHTKIKFQKSMYFKIILLGIVMVVSFTAFLVSAYRLSTVQLEREIFYSSQALSEQVCQNLDSRLKAMENDGFLPMELGQLFAESLDTINNSDDFMQTSLEKFRIEQRLEDWPYNNNRINWVAVLDNRGEVYTKRKKGVPSEKEIIHIFQESEYEQYYRAPGSVMWLSDRKGGMILIRAIFNMDKLEFCGYIIADMKTDQLEGLFSEDYLRETCAFILFDKNERLIYSSDENVSELAQVYGQSEFSDEKFREKYLALEYPLSQNTLKLICMVDLEKKNASFRSLMEMLMLVGFCVAVIFGAGILAVFLGTAQKIKQLLVHIDRVAAGDFQSRVQIESEDEIGMIAEHINGMSERVQILMEQTAESEKQRQAAHYQMLQFQYHVLQAQVNPHFLFNTLQSIQAAAILNEDYQISGMVQKLAKLYRSNIERTEVYCLLEEELEYIDNYLKLNQEIYQGRLNVVYHLDNSLNCVEIPTFVLQPLVENSLVHGMENKIGVCTIEITTYKKEGNLIVVIRDDGAGIPEERLKQIRERKLSEKRIGIWNVNRRIHLLYGKDYGITIESEVPVYTEVTVTLPCQNDRRETEGVCGEYSYHNRRQSDGSSSNCKDDQMGEIWMSGYQDGE